MDGANSTQSSSAASTKRKGKQCAAFGCSNAVYGADDSPTHFISSLSRDAKQRQHGKDGFFVTNSTVVCCKHFRKEDLCLSAEPSQFSWTVDGVRVKNFSPDLTIFSKGPSSLSPETLITLCTLFQSHSDNL